MEKCSQPLQRAGFRRALGRSCGSPHDCASPSWEHDDAFVLTPSPKRLCRSPAASRRSGAAKMKRRVARSWSDGCRSSPGAARAAPVDLQIITLVGRHGPDASTGITEVTQPSSPASEIIPMNAFRPIDRSKIILPNDFEVPSARVVIGSDTIRRYERVKADWAVGGLRLHQGARRGHACDHAGTPGAPARNQPPSGTSGTGTSGRARAHRSGARSSSPDGIPSSRGRRVVIGLRA